MGYMKIVITPLISHLGFSTFSLFENNSVYRIYMLAFWKGGVLLLFSLDQFPDVGFLGQKVWRSFKMNFDLSQEWFSNAYNTIYIYLYI